MLTRQTLFLTLATIGFASIHNGCARHSVPAPAFPGAEGYGAQSVGGRGGRVIEVTNLSDHGPGSLRAALMAKGPRIVVFRVAGIIELDDKIRIKNSYLTIAGQTAPGGGITIKGSDNSLLGVHKGAHDLIIRYLRLRNGSGEAAGSGNDNLTINGGHDIIVDHVSMSWSTDENVGVYKKIHHKPIHDVTFQRSIMAEGLAGHSNGMLISGQRDVRDPDNPIDHWRSIYNISIHHNLFVHNTHRNPRVTSGGTQVINNVTYNWSDRIGSTTRGSMFDAINNYFKAGPMSNIERLLLHENHSRRRAEKYPDPSLHVEGNIVEPVHMNRTADNWALYKIHYTNKPLPEHYRRHTPLPQGTFPVKVQSAYDAFGSVIADVGANARLDCLGNWVPNGDPIDSRLLDDVQNNTGPTEPIDNPDEVGGYPDIDPGLACTDSDHDGMPNKWEKRYSFDPKDQADSLDDADGDGYTNVEEYLNGTVPT